MARSDASNGRWVVPTTDNYGPQVVVAVIPELTDTASGLSTGHTIHAARCFHVVASRQPRDHWTHPEYKCFFDGDELHDWLESRFTHHRRIHVYTAGVVNALTLSRFWDRIELRGCTLGGEKIGGQGEEPVADCSTPHGVSDFNSAPLPAEDIIPAYRFKSIIVGQSVEIVRYRVDRRSLLWCSFAQYFEPDEESIAATIYNRTPAEQKALTGNTGFRRSPRDRAFLWCRLFCRLSDWWVKNDGGPWGPTVASCAFSYLRQRLKPRSILRHDKPTVGHLEEQAIFGGRRSVWFVGNVGTESAWEPFAAVAPARSNLGTVAGGMQHHDVRSMYPFLLERMEYPTKLFTTKRSMTVSDLRTYLESFGVLARVCLCTSDAEFPLRSERGISFPLGRFWTTLAGPELQLAVAAGFVEKVAMTALYTLGSPFQSAAGSLLDLRTKYRHDDEPVWELFAKSLANSMSGRMAQKAYAWIPRPKVAAKEKWGAFNRRNLDTGEVNYYQQLSGMVFEKVVQGEKCRQMGASYAYLTSYGRVLMRWVRESCGPRTVLSQDTDGIWTTNDAAARIYFQSDPSAGCAGDLRRDHVSPVGRFFGAQHYWCGRGWVLSGHSSPVIRPGTTRIKVTEERVPLFSCRGTPEPYLYVKESEREIGRLQVHGGIGEDGWVDPPTTWTAPENDEQPVG